jgi:hypothetical protein
MNIGALQASAAASLLLVLAVPALAQQPQISPGQTIGILKPGNAPQAPALVQPAPGHTFTGSSSRTTPLLFSWQPASSGATAQRFKVCLHEPGGRCGDSQSAVWDAGMGTSMTVQIPPRFTGKSLLWTAGACVTPAGNQPMPISGGGESCAWQSVERSLVASGAPAAPLLQMPAANAVVSTVETRFTWQPAAGAESYLFCVSRSGVSCSDQPTSNANTIVVARNVSQTFADADVARFHKQGANWTVASCVQGECTWQAPRPISVVLAAPQLASPANGATVPHRQIFTWQSTPWAQYYLLCISKPGVGCVTTETASANQIVKRFDGLTSGPFSSGLIPVIPTVNIGTDLQPFDGQLMHWSVAGCRAAAGAGTVCEYQNQVRGVQVQEQWGVNIELTSVQALETCDNVSDGDWKLNFIAVNSSSSDTKQKEWPSNSRDVKKGQTLTVGEVLGLTAGKDDTLIAGVSAMDCDADGIWTLSNVFSGISGIVSTVQNWTSTCRGEEAWEASGGNDAIGDATRELRPQDWKTMSNTRITVPSPGGRDCGLNPFTATFTVSSGRR